MKVREEGRDGQREKSSPRLSWLEVAFFFLFLSVVLLPTVRVAENTIVCLEEEPTP